MAVVLFSLTERRSPGNASIFIKPVINLDISAIAALYHGANHAATIAQNTNAKESPLAKPVGRLDADRISATTSHNIAIMSKNCVPVITLPWPCLVRS